jgi:hypothetical protein
MYASRRVSGFFLTLVTRAGFTGGRSFRRLCRPGPRSFRRAHCVVRPARPLLTPAGPPLAMTSSVFTGALAIALGAGTLAARPAQAQNQVANYTFGQPGTAAYEHFSFWTLKGRRSYAQYAYGKDRRDFQLRYLGPDRLNGQPCFKVKFSNGHLLYLVPSGTALRVFTSPTTPPKTFAWEYEGPVNGVGTNCSVCADDATAAMRLVRKHYLP